MFLAFKKSAFEAAVPDLTNERITGLYNKGTLDNLKV